MEVCQRGSIDLIKLLLADKRTDVNALGASFVCFMFHVFLRYLINKFYTPLMLACKGGSYAITKLLIEHKDINVNAKNFYFFCSMFFSMGFSSKKVFGISYSFLKQPL